MSKRISVRRMAFFFFFLALIFLFRKPEKTYAYTYQNSRSETINYRATFLNGQDETVSNGTTIELNNSGNCDNIWMNGFAAWVSGDYTGGVSYRTHRHNAGWGPVLGDGNLLTGNTGNYEWIEALSVKTTGDLNNYYYFIYQGLCVPVTQGYLVQASGGNEAELDRHNPRWRSDYANGSSLWYHWIFAGQNISTGSGLATGAPDGANFCGTAGYSLPLNGFRAQIAKYPCTLVVDPNGGSCEGNGSTYTIDGLNVDGTVNLKNPTRAGYEFTGWSVTGTEYQTRTAQTCQQQPDQNVAPVVTAGNGNASSMYGTDYSAVYDYNYYKSHNPDLQAFYGDNVSAYLSHFILYGMKEGRRANEVFDVGYYRDHNADLRNAFGNDLTAYYKHYMTNGIYEGRSGNGQGIQTCNASSIYLGNARKITIRANWRQAKYTVHFEGNGATAGSTPDQTMIHDVPAQLNKNGFSRSFQIGYDGNGGTPEKGADTAVSDFTGWLISAGAVNPSYSDEQTVVNIAEPGQTRNLYAGWHDNAVVLPNASKPDEYWEVSEDNKGWVRYYFTGWYTAPDGGQCVGRGGDAYTPKQNITLYAHWTYNVFVYYNGNTNDGGGMTMTDPAKGDEKTRGVDYIIRENEYTKTGYDFAGWNTAQVDGSGNVVETGLPRFTPGSIYNEDIPLTLFAAWQNRFDIAYMGVCQTEGDDYFDNNGGADYSQLTDTVKLAKSEDLKIQTTKSFVDAESGEEVVEDVTGTGVGWAFAKDIEAKYKEAYIADDTEYPARDFFVLARDTGAVTYGSVSQDYQGEVPQLNSPDMAVANMYRVWDYGPLIEAYDLYYTLDQAQNGYITEDELLSHAKATDEEDGEIPGGDHAEQNNSFRVMTYQAADFTGFAHGGSITETYLATDSVGNKTKLQITVHIADTTPTKDLTVGSTRFISEKYYNLPYEQGGLEDDSLWKADPEYAAELQQAFSSLQSDTPVASYKFDHDTILKMQEFVKNNGVGNSKSDDALSRFYNQFLVPNRQ